MNFEILVAPDWKDYSLLDSGNGQRLERFGNYTLIRPDPQILWQPSQSQSVWDKADAVFQRAAEDKGKWVVKAEIPEKWLVKYKNLKFYCKLTPFKHTGVFPEQAGQWDFIVEQIGSRLSAQAGKEANILSLFAYTGVATLAASQAGAKVTQVDASSQAISWAKENQQASGLEEKPIRWILDDAVKFCQRELKRGNRYDGIIMDPPIYGHGPKGETWDFDKSFPELMKICSQLLTAKPLFFLVNAYAISSSALMLKNVLVDYLGGLKGEINCGELALKQENSERLLSTGIFARWVAE